MQYLDLAASDLKISRVVHGCMGFGGDPATAVRVIHAAFDAGVTSFDTAPLYGYGSSEELLGRALRDRRDRVQILTKVGLRWDGSHGAVLYEATDASGARLSVRKDSRPASLQEEIEKSLRRLGTDRLDLVQVHHRDLETPIAETLLTLERLRRQGKVRAIGVSNYSLAELEESAHTLGEGGLSTVQLEYNLLKREAEREILPWALRQRVCVLAYSPLAQGVLAGKQLGRWRLPADWRRNTPYFSRGNLALVKRALEHTVLPIALERSASAAEVCLAWLLARPGLGAVIAGASSPEQAQGNARASELRLSPQDVARIGSAFSGFDPAPKAPSAGLRRLRAWASRLSRPRH
jgi:aryl-alcohol dehydrogenase-like predicted oxidoreductase